MATKKQAFEAKLGSWTDQASLTRTHQPSASAPDADAEPLAASPASRESYEVTHSLIDRIASTADAHGITRNEVVGHLLTWALDQLDAGHHTLPTGNQA